MTIEQTVLAALTTGSPLPTNAGSRVYAVLMPQGIALPAISYQRISNDPLADYNGDDGLDNVRLQVDCWGATYGAVKQLGEQVRAAFESAGMVFNLDNDRDEFELETKLYRLSMDFLIWGAA